MRTLFLPMLLLSLWAPAGSVSASDETWGAAVGRGDGTLEGRTFRLVRRDTSQGLTVETLLPARGTPQSRAEVELGPGGRLIRSRLEYSDPSLAAWYRADLILTEVQAGAAQGGGDQLAFQRVWNREVQEAKNLVWGPDFLDFSALPFVLEARIAAGDLGPLRFRTYFTDLPGTMEVTFTRTDRPLEAEARYSYPRALRWRFERRPVVLAILQAVGDFKGGYPFPFFYAFAAGPGGGWVASWGGNPQSPSFQWRE